MGLTLFDAKKTITRVLRSVEYAAKERRTQDTECENRQKTYAVRVVGAALSVGTFTLYLRLRSLPNGALKGFSLAENDV